MKRLVLILLILITVTAAVFAGLDAKDGKVVNVATPTDGTDAANKDYVDAHIVATDTPSSTHGTGTVGEVVWDNEYIYVCIATNSWLRARLEAWGDTMVYEDSNTMVFENGDEMIYE